MKNIARVKISDPAEVLSKATEKGISEVHPGAIWCEIPELGFEGDQLIYCRYGLAFPYLRVQVGSKVLVESTNPFDHTERFFYVGLVDCGAQDIDPTSDDQVIFDLPAGKFKIQLDSITAEIDSLSNKFSVDLGGGGTIELKGGQIAVNGTALTVDE